MVSHHQVILRTPREFAADMTGSHYAPAILQRSDEDFIANVLHALRDASGRQGLRTSLAKTPAKASGTNTRFKDKRTQQKDLFQSLRQASKSLGLPGGSFTASSKSEPVTQSSGDVLETIRRGAEGEGLLKLFQPIQGQFHLVVMEVHCDQPGEPRLDAARIAGAGLVVRRLQRDAKGRQNREGWMHAGEGLRGWVKTQADNPQGRAYDPDATRRLTRPGTGQPVLDQQLKQYLAEPEGAVLSEHEIPMFVAPPDVCKAAGKTYIYGLLPTTSSEKASAGAAAFDADALGPDSADFVAHLHAQLRGLAIALPFPGQTIAPDMAAAAFDKTHSEYARMQPFIKLLQQLSAEFDAFGDLPESQTVLTELNRIQLPLLNNRGEISGQTVAAGVFLQKAHRVLLLGDNLADAPAMPALWPAFGKETSDALASALSSALQTRFEALTGVAGRFDEKDARYCARAFVRLKADAQCPERTIWSDYTRPYVIAPWYEGSGAPPVQVPLPDPSDRDMLKQLKPNVSFVVPKSMQSLLAGDPEDLLEGKKPADNGLNLDWICSFNIPIITICAFIVLNIFLSLFNLFFQWLLFIKICIPFPRKG